MALTRSWIVSVLAISSAARAGASPDAHATVAAALDAMGGEAKLRAIKSVYLKRDGWWNSVEYSPRPEPPWRVDFDRVEEWLDFEHGAWRSRAEVLDPATGDSTAFELIADGSASAIASDGQVIAGGPVFLGDAAERLLYQPFRLALAAADAADLRAAGDEVVAGAPQHVVAFHRGAWPVKLWIDARTHRLTAAEVVHTLPDDYYWRVRGDVRDRLEFEQWALDPSGVWLARQVSQTRNGIPYHDYVVRVTRLGGVAPGAIGISDAVRADFRDKSRGPGSTPVSMEQPIEQLAPGIWIAPARWNALLVAQPTGAVMIDAPISEVYSGRMLDECRKRFGAPPVQAILTDHLIPHLSGVRELVARGVPVRALDENLPFIQSLLAAPHTLAPDALAKRHATAKLSGFGARTAIGSGASRFELIPMRTTLGARVALVWFPEPRLLWISGALTDPQPGQPLDASRLAELREVVAREHLNVDKVVGSHFGPADWSSVPAM